MGYIVGAFFRSLHPVRPAFHVLINNSFFNLISPSDSQCVSHIFNNGAVFLFSFSAVFCRAAESSFHSHSDSYDEEEERAEEKSQVYHLSTSLQDDNEQMHAVLLHTRVSDYLSSSFGARVSALSLPVLSGSHTSGGLRLTCSTIKQFLSWQWEKGNCWEMENLPI